MKKSIQVCMSLVALFGLASCGMIENLEEMHDKTVEMADTTSSMKEGTSRLEEKTSNTYSGLKKKSALEFLHDMDKAEDMDTKRFYAGAYYSGLRFQYYMEDTAADRNKHFEASVKEFLALIQDYTLEDMEVTPTERDNDSRNFYALVAAMHYVSEDQEVAAAKHGFSAVSMLDLLEQGLAEGNLPTASAHARLVEEERELVVYLFQVRYNVLVAAPLKEINPGLRSAGWWYRVVQFGLLDENWNPRYDHLTPAGIYKKCTRPLKGAKKAADVLIAANVLPELEENVAEMYENLEMDEYLLQQADSKSQKANAFGEFIDYALDELGLPVGEEA